MRSNGWTSCAILESRRVTRLSAGLSAAEQEAKDRAELARLRKLYPENP